MTVVERVSALVRRVIASRAGRTAGWGYAATAASVVTGVITARTLGPDHRGLLGLVLSVAGLAVMFGALGTTVSIRRHLPKRSEVNARGYDLLSLWLLPVVVAVLSVSLALLFQFVSKSFGDPWIAVAFVTYGLAQYFAAQSFDLLNAYGRMAQSAKIYALGSALCALLVLGVFLLHLGLLAIIAAYAASALFQGIATRLVLRGLADPRSRDEPAKGMGLLLRDGTRLLGLNVGHALTEQASTIMLGGLSTAASVGYFSVAKSPAALLRHPALALGQVALHDSAIGLDRRIVLRRIGLMVLAFTPITAVGWLVAEWVIPILFGIEFLPAIQVFRILMVAELVFVPFLVGSKALAGGGSRAGASLSSMVGLLLLVTSGLFLIPSLGAEGAAWSTLTAQAGMSAVTILLLLFSRPTQQDVAA